jgi:cell division transport system ATP-binding protein
MSLINYKNVNIYQDAQLVLKNVDFTVNEGEFIYITGKVGSGKSSLLKTIYAEIPVNEGDAEVLGFNMLKMKQKNVPDLRRKLGIIFQDFQLLTDRTVEANLRFVLKATGWKDKREIDQRIKDVLELVGMTTKGYKMPNELSGGEQQRISIARAILNRPQLILADEPTGNLDVETSKRITELLQSISKAGSTVIMITHNMNLLSQFPGRVFRCENQEMKELKIPTIFDLADVTDSFHQQEFFETQAEEDKAMAETANVESEPEPEPTVEQVATPEPVVEPTPVVESEPTPIVEETKAETETKPQATEEPEKKEQAPALKPIDLSEFEPSDISAINDIIEAHNAKNEVID